MRRWNLPQVNTKVMCAVLTAAMVTTGIYGMRRNNIYGHGERSK